MKRIAAILVFSSLIFLSVSCVKRKRDLKDVDFRAEMTQFVGELSNYAKGKNPDFLIIPQNGESLAEQSNYLDYTDGVGREDLNYGYDNDGDATGSSDKNEMVKYLDMFKARNQFVLVTDYVFSGSEDVPHFDGATTAKTASAYSYCISKGYIPYSTVRNLNYLTISSGHEPPEDSIASVEDINSFLYYLQPAESVSRSEYINNIAATNFDLVIMDMTYDGLEEFTKTEIQTIKQGLNNGKGGYVVAYMSIGEAEDYRYYFDSGWTKNNGKVRSSAPDWLYKENPDWEGNYKVLYWYDDWKKIIYGSSEAYLDKIIEKGFDGVYMDIIDAFEYYEDIMGM